MSYFYLSELSEKERKKYLQEIDERAERRERENREEEQKILNENINLPTREDFENLFLIIVEQSFVLFLLIMYPYQ